MVRKPKTQHKFFVYIIIPNPKNPRKTQILKPIPLKQNPHTKHCIHQET